MRITGKTFSNAKKFIIEIKNINEIKNSKKWITFYNPTDKKHQLVPINNKSIIILNIINIKVYKKLEKEFQKLSELNEKEYLLQLKEFLNYAKKLGVNDMYHSDQEFKINHLIKIKNTNLYQKIKTEISLFFTMENKGILNGIGNSGLQNYNEGDIVIYDEKNQEKRKIDIGAFLVTYEINDEISLYNFANKIITLNINIKEKYIGYIKNNNFDIEIEEIRFPKWIEKLEEKINEVKMTSLN